MAYHSFLPRPRPCGRVSPSSRATLLSGIIASIKKIRELLGWREGGKNASINL